MKAVLLVNQMQKKEQKENKNALAKQLVSSLVFYPNSSLYYFPSAGVNFFENEFPQYFCCRCGQQFA